MAEYRAKQKAETWTTFKNGELSGKGTAIQMNVVIFASVAGKQEETGDTILEITPKQFTKAKWFVEVVKQTPPEEETGDEWPDAPKPVGDWKRYFVKHDWESGALEPPYTVRNAAPAPEVFRVGAMDDHTSHVKVKFTKPMQFFLADLIAMQAYGVLLMQCTVTQKKFVVQKATALMGPTLFLFNRSKDAQVANYLTGENLSFEPPMMAPLICGGNTVWGIPAGKNKGGREMILLHSFSPRDTLPIVSPHTLLDPRVLWATNIYRGGVVGPFPQLKGLSAPYPFITFEPYYFPADGLEALGEGEMRSQYVPEREYYP